MIFYINTSIPFMAAVKYFIGILGLFGRKRAAKIVVYFCQCLCPIHIEIDGIEQ